MNIKKPNNCLNCKAKAELVRFGGGYYQCRCTGCGSLGRLTPYKSDAVKYWNEEHRPEPETLPENVGFVSISADEYAEYVRLKEAAKPLSIDQMREYCIKWCEGLNLHTSEERRFAHGLSIMDASNVFPPKGWLFNGSIRIAAHPDYMAAGHVIEAYALIRAIERGELGGQNA